MTNFCFEKDLKCLFSSFPVLTMSTDEVLIEENVKLGQQIHFDGNNIVVRSGAQIDSGALICDGVEIGQVPGLKPDQ